MAWINEGMYMDIGSYKQCQQCRGTGRYAPLGSMDITCSKCDGSKYNKVDVKAMDKIELQARSIDKRSKVYRLMKAKAERLLSTENHATIQPVSNQLIGC